MDNSQIVEAAGAVLSQKNTSTIKSAWQALTEILLASGNLSFADIPKELISAQSVYDAQKKHISAGGRLSEMVTAETWHQTMRTVMDYFQKMFYGIVCCSDADEDAEDTDTDKAEDAAEKKAQVSELISDFLAVIQDLAKNPPKMPAPAPMYNPEVSRVYASSHQTTPEQEIVVEPETEQTPAVPAPAPEPPPVPAPETKPPPISELERLFQESVALEEEPQLAEVQAAEHSLSLPLLDNDETLTLQIEAKARFDVSATNERVVEGILFKIDRPSEAIPNVGPGLPLYIPRKVAVEALECLDFSRPKPLDAHDSLSQHASTEIVGAMTSARIDGEDFWVAGVLWDYNQPNKVEAISASQDHLGMSVNATAEGHPTNVDGRSVWQIDRLRILGANILFSEKATFKKTRTNVLASSESGDLIPVLASADDFEIENATNETSETMDTTAIAAQIRELSDSVANMHSEMKNRINALEPTVQALATQMGEIQAAAQVTKNQELQAAAMQAEQAKQAQLIQSMTAVIEDKLATIAPKTGPKYPSRPLPLAASGVTPTTGTMAVQLELAGLDGEIRAIESNPHLQDAKLFELMDRRKSLQAQVTGLSRE